MKTQPLPAACNGCLHRFDRISRADAAATGKFTEVRSSGLQMTRSPGAFLVYWVRYCWCWGTVFMFYIREKRAWLLFSDGRIRFAMSSSRNERDLQKEFPQHTRQLQQLAKDLNHE